MAWGRTLVEVELAKARGQLNGRLEDLDKANRHVQELVVTCDGLRTKIAELERDLAALDRGYIAFMGDAATKSA